MDEDSGRLSDHAGEEPESEARRREGVRSQTDYPLLDALRDALGHPPASDEVGSVGDILAKWAASPPPLEEYHNRCDQFIRRETVIVAGEFALKMAEARANQDFDFADELARRIDKVFRSRRFALDHIHSADFARDFENEWRNLIREIIEEYTETGEIAEATCSPQDVPFKDFGDLLAADPRLSNWLFADYVAKHVRPSLEEARRRGGRRGKWDSLWKVIQEFDAKPEHISDQRIAAVYNQRYAASISYGKLERADHRKVAEVRANRKRAVRKQSHD